MADQMNGRALQGVEKIEIMHRDVGDVADPVGIVGQAEAGMLRNQEPAAARESVEERSPRRPPTLPVQKEQGLALAVATETDAHIAHRMLVFLHGHHRRSSLRDAYIAG